jgi:hypothetical protein
VRISPAQIWNDSANYTLVIPSFGPAHPAPGMWTELWLSLLSSFARFTSQNPRNPIPGYSMRRPKKHQVVGWPKFPKIGAQKALLRMKLSCGRVSTWGN